MTLLHLVRVGCLTAGLGLAVGLAQGQGQPPPAKKTPPPPPGQPQQPPPANVKVAPLKPKPHPAPMPVVHPVRPLPPQTNPVANPAAVVNNPANPFVNSNWVGYNIPLANAYTPYTSPMLPAYPPSYNPYATNPLLAPTYMPVSMQVPLTSFYRSPLQFSSGLNNPYWGNSGNPFQTLSSPLTFSPGLNNPYWSGGIQNAANQANTILMQQMLLQSWYSQFSNPYSPWGTGPFTNPYGLSSPSYSAFPRGLDAGPLGAPGVAVPLGDGMANIGAAFPVGLGR